MKQVVIAFVIALVVGSFINGMNGSTSMGGGGGATCGTGGSGMPGPGGSPDQINNAVADQTAQAGLELVANVDEGSFQGYVLDSKEPVLVEFYTDSCPHCISMRTVMGKLAYNGQGIVRLCKVNAEKSAALAERYNVQGVPAFCLFSEGHIVDSTSGARDMDGMKNWLSLNNINVPDTPKKI